jgi:hypothetical protein
MYVLRYVHIKYMYVYIYINIIAYMYWIVLVGVLASSHLLPIIFEYHDPSQEIGGKHV